MLGVMDGFLLDDGGFVLLEDDDDSNHGANDNYGLMLGAVGGIVIRENSTGMTSISWPG